ncbi:MAG: type IV pilus secretin PilQ, partial [Myxococcota bacterium]
VEEKKVDAAAASPSRTRFIKPARDSGPTESAIPASAEVFGLQFERSDERDRVAILSDAMVDYSIFEPDAETVMIRIPNARFTGDSGERITPDSGGPVSLITTFEQPELDGSEVRVVMRRAKGLVPTVTRRATVILVDFENTGLAASAPPAFLPDEPAFLSEKETYANRLETEGQLPADSSGLPGDDVDPDTSPLEQLNSGVANGVTDSRAFHAALGVAERRAEKETPALPAGLPMTGQPAKAPPAAVAIPAAVDVLSEGGLIEEKKYTGRRISLDFKDVLISDVLRLIAEVSDLNIIAGDEVKGSMTIRLVDVPWDQALDVILLTKGLGFMRVGNVLRIAPSETLKAEEETRLQERRQKEKLEDLEVKLQPINYADVNDVKSLVSRLLSPRGTVNVDARTNTVIIKDISSVIDEAVALILAIDTQTPQVMIEAKIVEANLDFARELGTTWSFGSQPYVDGFNPGALRTDLGSENFKFAGANNVVVGNPITSAATGTINFGAFLLDDKMQVDVHIQAMEQAGEGKVISSPRVVTLDNREASIEQGVSIPFQTFESGDAKLEFIDAVLSLKVTPHITRDKSIIMSLEVTRNAPDTSIPTSTGSPAIAKNQAKTETLVKDGQTLVIGGIYTIEKSTRESRVPYLYKIPLIGRAFKSRQVSDKRKELLIFVTPRIVVNPALASSN